MQTYFIGLLCATNCKVIKNYAKFYDVGEVRAKGALINNGSKTHAQDVSSIDDFLALSEDYEVISFALYATLKTRLTNFSSSVTKQETMHDYNNSQNKEIEIETFLSGLSYHGHI